MNNYQNGKMHYRVGAIASLWTVTFDNRTLSFDIKEMTLTREECRRNGSEYWSHAGKEWNDAEVFETIREAAFFAIKRIELLIDDKYADLSKLEMSRSHLTTILTFA